MTTPAKPVDLPKDIIAAFDALCAAARIPGKLGVVRACTEHYPYEQFVIGIHRDDGMFLPIAVMPKGKTIIDFLGGYDYLMGVAGTAQLDPEYKGVKM